MHVIASCGLFKKVDRRNIGQNDIYLIQKRIILCIRNNRLGKHITTDNQRKERCIKKASNKNTILKRSHCTQLPIARV